MKKSLLAMFLLASAFSFASAQSNVGDVDPESDSSVSVEGQVCYDLKYNLASKNVGNYRNSDRYTQGEVTKLQEFLQDTNFLNVEATGYFGLKTIAAVKKFQTSLSILSTGYVGPVTRAKIKAMSCGGTVTPTCNSEQHIENGVCKNNTTMYTCPNGSVIQVPAMAPPSYISANCNISIETDVPPPSVVTSVAPTSVKIGDNVTITGFRFTPAGNVVYLDGYLATAYFNKALSGALSSLNGSSISFTMPEKIVYVAAAPIPAGVNFTAPPAESLKILPGVHTLVVKNSKGVSNSISFTVVASECPAPGTIVNGVCAASSPVSTQPVFTYIKNPSGTSPLSVDFYVRNVTNCSYASGYSIDFGDGQSAAVSVDALNSPNSNTSVQCGGYFAKHTYSAAGTYTAKLMKNTCPVDAQCFVGPATIASQVVTLNSVTTAGAPIISVAKSDSIRNLREIVNGNNGVISLVGSGFTPFGTSVYVNGSKIGTTNSNFIPGNGGMREDVTLRDAQTLMFRFPKVLFSGCGQSVTSVSGYMYACDPVAKNLEPGVYKITVQNQSETSNAITFTVYPDDLLQGPSTCTVPVYKGGSITDNYNAFVGDCDDVTVTWPNLYGDLSSMTVVYQARKTNNGTSYGFTKDVVGISNKSVRVGSGEVYLYKGRTTIAHKTIEAVCPAGSHHGTGLLDASENSPAPLDTKRCLPDQVAPSISFGVVLADTNSIYQLQQSGVEISTLIGESSLSNVAKGAKLRLGWSTIGAGKCIASEGWSGQKGTGGPGNYDIDYANMSKKYVLTCYSQDLLASSTKSVMVTVAGDATEINPYNTYNPKCPDGTQRQTTVGGSKTGCEGHGEGNAVVSIVTPKTTTSGSLALGSKASSYLSTLIAVLSGAENASAESCANLATNLHRGNETESVSKLQNFLIAKGFLSEKASGFFGDLTIEAVKAYQRSLGLPETGMVYGVTRQAIREETCQ